MPPALEIITAARQMYADRVPVADIRAALKISKEILYHCVDGGCENWPVRLPPLPRRREGAARTKKRPRLRGERKSIIRRVWRTAEAQVREIELRLAQPASEPDERERDARLLAVLVKTLRELSALDAAGRESNKQTEPEDDPVPRDLDEFRRELARKMDAIISRRTDRAAREPARE